MTSYRNRRAEIYQPLRQEGIFTWDWMYGKEYALAGLQAISRRDLQELRQAAEGLGGIFSRTMDNVQLGEAALLQELGIPAAAIEAVRMSFLPNMPTLIGRFDFSYTTDGWKLLELNSDTPGGIVEAFYVNDKVCRYYGEANPNAGMEAQLKAAFQQAVGFYRDMGYKTDRVVFSALDWHDEDAGTARYLMRCSGLPARFAPLADLKVFEDALYAQAAQDLEPIDVLYRLHPLGIMAGETDVDGYPTGAHILDLAARRKAALINPPSALITQSKALQALIWNLHEAGSYFTEQEHTLIESYMLPTYFENRFQHRRPYVTKPIFGREGGAVTIYGKDGAILAKDQENQYWEQDVIYQQYVDLQQVNVETIDGMYAGRLIWGAFLIGGKASAVAARVGGRITDDMAYFLPVKIQ